MMMEMCSGLRLILNQLHQDNNNNNDYVNSNTNNNELY